MQYIINVSDKVLYLSPFSTVSQCSLGNLVLPTNVKIVAKITSVHACLMHFSEELSRR